MRRRKPNNGEDEDNGFKQWGGYMQAKKAKLQEQYEETVQNQTEKLSDIFKDIIIFVNGLTNPSSDELKKLMVAHGGTFHLYQNSNTTHIIASNLPNVKINKLGSVPIVKPSWITDSIEIGKLLDYRSYLLYTNQSSTQPKLQFPAKTASDPNFLQEFYGNSRLHLIATLGAEFKHYITQLREKTPPHTFPALSKLVKRKEPLLNRLKIIMHIDMDCFFVSVAIKSHPELKGQPVAVTHARNPQVNASNERNLAVAHNLDRLPMRMELIDGKSSMSEIACCSYEARKYGIKNGMFLGAAAKLCPELKTIPYDFDGYKTVSKLLYDTISSYTLNIEAVSCDEMYVDITDLLKNYELTIEQWSQHIRNEILQVTDCSCSTGFGSNRLQARMATKKAKPNGSYYLQPENVLDYFANIQLSQLPGVGYAILNKLDNLKLKTCADLLSQPLNLLQKELGIKIAQTIHQQAQGIDNKPLNFHYERKSVSAEINYGIRFETLEETLEFLHRLSIEAWTRLDELKMKSRCVTLKLMVRSEGAPIETAKYLGHGICDNFSKSITTNYSISNAEHVFKEIQVLWRKLNINFRELRGVGVQLSKLEKEKTTNNSLNKFFETAKKEKVKENKKIGDFYQQSKDITPSTSKKQQGIDLTVLNELPEDVRNEIIKEYGLETENNTKTEEKQQQIERSIFDGLSWNDLKTAIQHWFETEKIPNNIDIEMLGKHFEQLAINRKIDVLKVAFQYLHRTINEMHCDWHKAYFSIAEFMQKGMVARYGVVLMIPRSFSCENCYFSR